MTSVLLPEGELRVARCDMLDKLIAVGDGDAALLYLYILRHGGTDGSAAARALRLSADRYERGRPLPCSARSAWSQFSNPPAPTSRAVPIEPAGGHVPRQRTFHESGTTGRHGLRPRHPHHP